MAGKQTRAAKAATPLPPVPPRPKGIAPGLIQMAGGEYQSPWRINNPPKDKHIQFVGPNAMKLGQFHGWQVYTPEQYAADKERFETWIQAEPEEEGERLVVSGLWAVWVPIEHWNYVQAVKEQRTAAMKTNHPTAASDNETITVKEEVQERPLVPTG